MQVIQTPVAEEVRSYQMLIGGEWVDAQSGRTFESVNPFTGKAWATIPEANEADVDAAVRAAREAFDEGPWAFTPIVRMRIRDEKTTLTVLIAQPPGIYISGARSDVPCSVFFLVSAFACTKALNSPCLSN